MSFGGRRSSEAAKAVFQRRRPSPSRPSVITALGRLNSISMWMKPGSVVGSLTLSGVAGLWSHVVAPARATHDPAPATHAPFSSETVTVAADAPPAIEYAMFS